MRISFRSALTAEQTAAIRKMQRNYMAFPEPEIKEKLHSALIALSTIKKEFLEENGHVRERFQLIANKTGLTLNLKGNRPITQTIPPVLGILEDLEMVERVATNCHRYEIASALSILIEQVRASEGLPMRGREDIKPSRRQLQVTTGNYR